MNPSIVLATSSRVRFISFPENKMSPESLRCKRALKAFHYRPRKSPSHVLIDIETTTVREAGRPAGILPDLAFETAGKMPICPTGWKPVLQRQSGGDSSDRRRPFRQLKSLLFRRTHFLFGFAHVCARLLDRIEFLLLRRRQERADLRPNVVVDRFDSLSRFLPDRHDLRLGLFDDWADLRLLLGRQVQGFRHVFERVAPSPVAIVPARILRGGILGIDD